MGVLLWVKRRTKAEQCGGVIEAGLEECNRSRIWPAYEVLSSGKDIDLSYQASSRIYKIVFSAILERKLANAALQRRASQLNVRFIL